MKLLKRHCPTMDQIESSEFSLDSPGVCLACGDEAYDCEPDTEHRQCESCGQHAVFAFAECGVRGWIKPDA